MNSLFRFALVLASSAAMLTGCRHQTAGAGQTIPLVQSILADTQSRGYAVFSSFEPHDTHGTLAILDEPERCIMLSERFLACDTYDNFSGRESADLLPDFAGETIASALDVTYSPYGRFVAASNEDALRDLAVRSAVAALDTVCSRDRYDEARQSSKQRAKMLVISSPYIDACASFDIDTLCRAFGADIPVVSTSSAVAEYLLGRKGSAARLGVVVSPAMDVASVYSRSLTREFARQGSGDSACHVLEAGIDSAATALDLLTGILDNYAKSGNTPALDALMVDDESIPVDSLRAACDFILSHPDEDNFPYRRLLAAGFEIIDASQVLVEKCYRVMRSRKLFTHNIAYPIATAYVTSPDEKSLVLMDLDFEALPGDVLATLTGKAPKTHRSYVQDKHHTRGN